MVIELRRSAARGAGRLFPLLTLCGLLGACDSGRSPEPAVGGTSPRPGPAVETTAARVPDPDILLITLDTLRADALGFAGHPRVATPQLDRLAAAGRVFTHAHAHNVVTLPSHTNLLTGLFPYQHGVRDNSGFVLDPAVPTLAERFRAAGYQTAAFVAAYPLDSRFGLDRGFDVYDDAYRQGGVGQELSMAERSGTEVVALAERWWRSQAGKKRFLWVHLYDPHAPYVPPEPFASQYRDAPYLGEVAATDSYLAPLLEPIVEGRDEPTVVVVTSDHGEGLGEHGELTHGLFAYEATLKVPLVLFGPGVPPGKDDRSVGHVDVAPTLLAVAGLPPLPKAAGENLFGSNLPAERQLYFEALSSFLNQGWAPLHGLLEDRTKYIHLPLPELYNLGADPREAENLIDRERRTATTLRAALPPAALEAPRRAAISAAEAERLRSLGYLVGGAQEGGETRLTPADDPKNLVGLSEKLFRVVALYSERRLPEAEKVAREIVRERPSTALGWEYLATVLRDQGRLEEAVAALEEGVAKAARRGVLVRQLALGLAELGRGPEAVQLLGDGREEQDLDNLNALAVALFSAARYAEAEPVLQRVLARDAGNTKALETLGGVVLAQGRAAEARQALERAVAANPDLPVAWNSLGVARQLTGDTAGALAAWQRATQLDQRLYDAWFNLGLTAAATGRRDLARSALGHFVQKAPPGRYRDDIARARQVLAGLEGRR